MTKRIKLPDGSIGNFPADMPDADIEAVLAEQFPQKSAPRQVLDAVGAGAREVVGAVAEPVLKMATGAIAKPVGDIAGLVSGTWDVATGGRFGGRGAQEVQQGVQKALTYAPRTVAGASEFNPLNALPEALGKGLGAVGAAGADVVGGLLPGDMQDSSSLAGMGANATREAIPQLIGIGGAKFLPKATASAGQKLQQGSEKIMRSALGPTPAEIASGEAQAAARTLLREGVSPNLKGVERLRALQTEAQAATDAAVTQAGKGVMGSKGVRSQKAPTVSAQGVVDELSRYEKALRKQVDPMADVAAITQLSDRFLMHPDVLKGQISLPAAHAMQRGTTAKLAGESSSRAPSVLAEGQRLTAEALRKGVTEAAAKKGLDAGSMFAREADLANALSAAERRTFADLTKNPVDIALYIRNPAAKAAYLANKSTPFKAFVAKYLNKAGSTMETVGTSADALFSGELYAPQ